MEQSHDTVGCPVCMTRYIGKPDRCETCGYRFTDTGGDECL